MRALLLKGARFLALLALVPVIGVAGCTLLRDVDQHLCEAEESCGGGVGGTGGSLGGRGAVDGGTGGTLAMAGSGGTGQGGSCPECELVVEYQNGEDTLVASRIRPIFRIKNEGSEPVELSRLTLRYYYSMETMAEQLYECSCAFGVCEQPTCSEYVHASFTPVSGKTTNMYLELSFTEKAGQLGGAGLATAKIQGVIRADGADYNQENDYSFNADQTAAFAPWDHVTLYRDGELVWGVEP